MEAISVPRPPRLVPMISSRYCLVKPDSKRAAGTLLITWLAPMETSTSLPVSIPPSIAPKAGSLPTLPMNTKNPQKVRSRE